MLSLQNKKMAYRHAPTPVFVEAIVQVPESSSARTHHAVPPLVLPTTRQASPPPFSFSRRGKRRYRPPSCRETQAGTLTGQQTSCPIPKGVGARKLRAIGAATGSELARVVTGLLCHLATICQRRIHMVVRRLATSEASVPRRRRLDREVVGWEEA